jgi:nucleoside 2-deoxyribosyltransferase
MNRHIFIAGPYYSPEDRYQADAIEEALRRHNYTSFIPHRDGIDWLYSGKISNGDTGAFELARAVFALNVYVLAERCAGLVFNMNGRVPDEGGIILSALAFMLGKPVILFKNDARSKLHGHDNSMISGCGHKFRAYSDIEHIPGHVDRLNKDGAGDRGARELSRPLQAAIDAGGLIWRALDGRSHGETGPSRGLAGKIIAICGQSGFGGNNPGSYYVKQGTGRKVYCSGPLFCPAEIVEMDRIASVLESAGYESFLPHRDGLEAFVLNQVDNPLANGWLAAPLNRLMHRGGFAIDLHAIVNASDFFVVNTNGRVPDDGAMSEIGLAFAAGRPIVIYNNDSRGFANSRLDPMILGAACQAGIVREIGQLPQVLNRIAARIRPEPGSTALAYPAKVEKILRRGRRFLAFIGKIKFLKPGSLFGVPVSR